MDYEARAAAPEGKAAAAEAQDHGRRSLLALIFHRLGRPAGGFDPMLYKSDVARNSDFRKFDDGLKMTIDVDAERFDRIESRLEEAAEAGHLPLWAAPPELGADDLHRASPMTRDHMHFIDGAAGGYAMAASNLKARYAADRAGEPIAAASLTIPEIGHLVEPPRPDCGIPERLAPILGRSTTSHSADPISAATSELKSTSMADVSSILLDRVADWLTQSSLAGNDLESVVRGLCERLAAAGLPIKRVHLSFSMLHPLYDALGFTWERGGGMSVERFRTKPGERPERFLRSPYYHLHQQQSRSSAPAHRPFGSHPSFRFSTTSRSWASPTTWPSSTISRSIPRAA